MPRSARIALALIGVVCLLLPNAWGQQRRPTRKPPRRVAPKPFNDSTLRDFFPDVRSALQGERPSQLGAAAAPAAAGPAPGATAGDSSTSVGGAGAWATLISASTIENELKAIKGALDADVTTPGDFKGRGYEVCRTHFTIAAVLFSVIGEYDGQIRWKDSALGAREVFARTGKNCKVGTSQVYNEAKQRKQELEDLVGGGTFAGKPTDPQLPWDQICDRGPLMKRLERSRDEKIAPAIADAAAFKASKELLIHEAELIAMLSQVLMTAPLEDAGDANYDGFAKLMLQSAREIIEGCKSDNLDQVRKAHGTLNKSCDDCHETYRG